MKKKTGSKIAEAYWQTEAGQKIAAAMHSDGWDARLPRQRDRHPGRGHCRRQRRRNRRGTEESASAGGRRQRHLLEGFGDPPRQCVLNGYRHLGCSGKSRGKRIDFQTEKPSGKNVISSLIKFKAMLLLNSEPPLRGTAKRPVRNPPADREKSATFFLRYFFHIPFAFHQHRAVPFYRRIIGLFFINHWIKSIQHAKLRDDAG